MSDWIPDSKPSWWSAASDFFNSPKSTVRDWIAGDWLRRQIASMVVGGLIAFYLGALEYLQEVFIQIRVAVWSIQGALSTGVRSLFLPLISLVNGLEALFVDVVVAAGPFAFLVGFVVFAVAAISIGMLVRLLIRVIPFL